ncbi:MAG: diguanylate cyclase [Myxococcota bacterium]
MNKRVLVVDDDRLIREMARDALAQEGFRVHPAESGSEALDWLRRNGPVQLLLTDLSMREMDGFELMEQVQRDWPATEVVVLTGYASLESALQAMRLGAADYLRKPVTPPEIVYCVKRTLLRQRLLSENEALRACIMAFEAARSLTACLETADVLPLALDIILRVLDRERAVGRLARGHAHASGGVHLRGFPSERVPQLRDDIQRGKLFDHAALESPASRDSASLAPLVRMGFLEEREEVLGLPLSLDGRIVGGIWVLPGGQPFAPDDVQRAELVATQAELAMINAERFVQARERAFVDDVTGLYNARYLLSALDRELSRAARAHCELSVLFLDLDRFKNVNDQYGHLVGSRILLELGQVLLAQIRAIDTVGRYGGDEFTILLVDTAHDPAIEVAERIRQAVEEATFGADRGLELGLTLSIGVASYPTNGETGELLLDLSDKAMYLGKALGRNKVCSANELSDSRPFKNL